jgi:hypothetical protein
MQEEKEFHVYHHHEYTYPPFWTKKQEKGILRAMVTGLSLGILTVVWAFGWFPFPLLVLAGVIGLVWTLVD